MCFSATIQAVTFQDVLKLKQNHVQDIASFREQRLYGRHINRQSGKLIYCDFTNYGHGNLLRRVLDRYFQIDSSQCFA